VPIPIHLPRCTVHAISPANCKVQLPTLSQKAALTPTEKIKSDFDYYIGQTKLPVVDYITNFHDTAACRYVTLRCHSYNDVSLLNAGERFLSNDVVLVQVDSLNKCVNCALRRTVDSVQEGVMPRTRSDRLISTKTLLTRKKARQPAYCKPRVSELVQYIHCVVRCSDYSEQAAH